MGIPRFFQWIKNRYPSVLNKVNSNHILTTSIDNLYLDMNGIFHTVCQEVFEYGSHARMRKRKTDETFQQKQLRVYAKICHYIDELVQIVQPQKTLVLTIDGVAPLSKQAQQRQRRFRAAKERKDAEFDSNSITPGTSFLHNLGIYLNGFIARQITRCEMWRKFTTIYSNDKVPGEGEHKIINYIRMRKATSDEFLNEVHCMYGLDADLVMLSLVTHLPNFYLLRKDIYSNEEMDFYLVDIGLFRNYLQLELSAPGCNNNSLIDDFVLICFLVGNDFLPHQPTLDILTQGIEIMFTCYSDIFQKVGHLTRGNEIQWPSLSKFFQHLGDMEGDLLIQKVLKDDITYPDLILKTATTFTPDGKVQLRFTDWREMYYFNKLQISINSNSLDKLCLEYCTGLKWVFQYYKSGCPKWRWLYPYHYAPLVSDVAEFLKVEDNINSIPRFQIDSPILPFHQLMSVLPYESRHLLPKPIQRLLHFKSEIGEYYPKHFDIDRDGTKYDWEGIVILPFVDINKIIEASKPIIDEMSQDEIGNRILNARNCIATPKIFYYSPKSNYTFRNKFGDIENCCTSFKTIEF